MKKLVLVALIVLQFSIYKVNEAKPINNVEKGKVEMVLCSNGGEGGEVTNNLNIESYNVLEYDKELNLEGWMLDDKLFIVERSFEFLEYIEVEDRLILDDWMIDSDYWL